MMELGDREAARFFLEDAEGFVRAVPRLGRLGFGVLDAEIAAAEARVAAAAAEHFGAVKDHDKAGIRWFKPVGRKVPCLPPDWEIGKRAADHFITLTAYTHHSISSRE